jgi:hypothetical protein
LTYRSVGSSVGATSKLSFFKTKLKVSFFQGGTSVHNHHHHHHQRKEKVDGTDRSGSSKHHLHHQPHSHDGVTGTQGQQTLSSTGGQSHHQHSSNHDNNLRKGVNEACCAASQSSAIHIRREGAGPPGLDPGCATSPPSGFAPSILGPGATRGFTPNLGGAASSLMHKSASSTHLQIYPVTEIGPMFAGASTLDPLPQASLTSPPGLFTHSGPLSSSGCLTSPLVPLDNVGDVSSSDHAFHVQYVKNIIREEIDDLRDDIRAYVLQVSCQSKVLLG